MFLTLKEGAALCGWQLVVLWLVSATLGRRCCCCCSQHSESVVTACCPARQRMCFAVRALSVAAVCVERERTVKH